MLLEDALHSVAVIGAAGKMGRGIALLLLQEMAWLKLKSNGRGSWHLYLVDSDSRRFTELRRYFKQQLIKEAERQIITLREAYREREDLVSNKEMIDAFVEDSLTTIILDEDVHIASRAHLIFEAIVEDLSEKVALFTQLKECSIAKPYFLTNTSSIPIHLLNEKANLEGRIAGFHFYNPPPVQKLVELTVLESSSPELKILVDTLAQRLRKQAIPSRDVAGFISNGYFMREIAFASALVEKLSQKMPTYAAIYCINKVTQEWLLRPMGIFQLIDFVGIDVCQRIAAVMNAYLKDVHVQTTLLPKLLDEKIVGGISSEGMQEPGFFLYRNSSPDAVYALGEGGYRPFEQPWKKEWDTWLGLPPDGEVTWKNVSKSPARMEVVDRVMRALNPSRCPGDAIALDYLSSIRDIAHLLVDQKTARSLSDISTILQLGFSHPYGPDASFFSQLHAEGHK